ncbi:FCD domain-containing protein [uncultured Roseibium sp.]|uniref:FCD domain-containing protein n=1 Tax=uncultured Roseibium sp. TaxID=1936171 RepID=UPI002595C9CA|nr:FCD domain-containing protein [uncultured Roseibium sp.]
MENKVPLSDGGESGRAADNVVAALEAQIVSGSLQDQAPLPAERDLMEQFGTSRTVIREAISKLSSLGLVETRPRFRPIVRKPDYATVLNACGNVVQHLLTDRSGIKNLYDSRVFIERALVRDAALTARKEELVELKAALEANRNAIPDSLAFYRTDVAFHGVLYRIPRNPIFPAIHEGYTSWLAPQWDQMLRSPERNEVNYLAHKAILDAILERDPVAAEEALTNHLKAAWEFVRVTFDWDKE